MRKGLGGDGAVAILDDQSGGCRDSAVRPWIGTGRADVGNEDGLLLKEVHRAVLLMSVACLVAVPLNAERRAL